MSNISTTVKPGQLIASLDFQNIKNNIHNILTLFRSANDMGRKWIASLDSLNSQSQYKSWMGNMKVNILSPV
jgi:hypothetical protein